MRSIEYFDNKQDALAKITPSKKLLCNRNIKKFFLADSYDTFLNVIKSKPFL